MYGTRQFEKILCLILVFCFFSGALHSSACAVQLGRNLPFGEMSNPALEGISRCLASTEPGDREICSDDEFCERLVVMSADEWGWIVVYHIFMFINSGRHCLETLDPAPCRAMVNHLFWALFLGTLLEAL